MGIEFGDTLTAVECTCTDLGKDSGVVNAEGCKCCVALKGVRAEVSDVYTLANGETCKFSTSFKYAGIESDSTVRGVFHTRYVNGKKTCTVVERLVANVKRLVS